MSIDSAMKDGANNDWSVITVWVKCGKEYFLIDVIRKKMNFPELQKCVKQLRQQYRSPRILVEDKGSGTSLIQQLRVDGIHCIPCKPIGDKVERFATASIAFEQGKAFFPDNNPPWLECLEHELLAFPGCKHDDQVDSVSQFLNWAITNASQKAQIVKLSGL